MDNENGPYFQSKRLDIYQKYINKLIEEGKAYYCFCSKERLNELREKALKEKKNIMYDKHCRNLSEEEKQKFIDSGVKPVVRFKIPDIDGDIKVNDYLRGEINISYASQEDFIIQKADKYPTYHFANIVDDKMMGITHVLRGEEWIPSLAKHVLLYNAFDWKPPVFVHLPVILDPSGGKAF